MAYEIASKFPQIEMFVVVGLCVLSCNSQLHSGSGCGGSSCDSNCRSG